MATKRKRSQKSKPLQRPVSTVLVDEEQAETDSLLAEIEAALKEPEEPVTKRARGSVQQGSARGRGAKTSRGKKKTAAKSRSKGETPETADAPIEFSLDSPVLQIPLLPMRNDVAFPEIIIPLVVGREKGILLLDDVNQGAKLIGLATQIDPEVDEPDQSDLYPTLCIAVVLKMLKFPDGSTRVVAQGLKRARLKSLIRTEPYLVAEVEPFENSGQEGMQEEALKMAARRHFNELMDSGAPISEELQVAAMNTPEPSGLGDLLASGLPFTVAEKHQLLEEANVRKRLKMLNSLLRHQVEMQNLASKIQGEVTSEMSRAQREQYLRHQMQVIKRELGEGEDEGSELQEFYERMETINLPEAALKEARREFERMSQMHPSTPEYHVIRTYLDTLLSMPWHESTEDNLDIRRAHKILDEDHYDLVKVKERILEYLSVLKLKNDMRGPILCFVGPPGVGKTSLGRSIARTMSRKFIRISLGGVHDEAEIRGHRRTYIGAMPGRIVQGLRRTGTKNPVFMLDEIDKLGHDYRGDPSSALLEVLDPEQNNTFRDHYLDVEFDLSKVLFICTANTTSTIPSPLLDRMEILELSGYSEEEKLMIARQHLIPKQLAEHGLTTKSVEFADDGIREAISSYTREAGLRSLEREVATLCRKVARNHAEGNKRKVKIDARKANQLLGPPKYIRELRDTQGVPGVASGLAWTPVGGETLTIETVRSPGKGGLKLTGSLGDVMKESAHAALGYLHSHAPQLGLVNDNFDNIEFHVHVPAGAISKDGPSAGVAIMAGLLSLLRNEPLRQHLAMTGEITLTGRVLPVGGIREKVLAARREGFDTVIMPAQNEKDTTELPPEVFKDLSFVFVKHIDEVVPYLFGKEPILRSVRGRGKVVVRRTATNGKQPRVPSSNPTRHAQTSKR